MLGSVIGLIIGLSFLAGGVVRLRVITNRCWSFLREADNLVRSQRSLYRLRRYRVLSWIIPPEDYAEQFLGPDLHYEWFRSPEAIKKWTRFNLAFTVIWIAISAAIVAVAILSFFLEPQG